MRKPGWKFFNPLLVWIATTTAATLTFEFQSTIV